MKYTLLWLTLVLITLLAWSCEIEDLHGNGVQACAEIDASFTINLADPSCKAPCDVEFVPNNLSPSATYEWDFGDGQTSTESIPTHTYENTGRYSVSLTITESFIESICKSEPLIETLDIDFNTFELLAGLAADEELIDVVQAPDGSFLAVGTRTQGEDANTFVMLIDEKGDNSNIVSLGGFRNTYAKSIVSFNNNYLIASTGGIQGTTIQEVTTTGARINECDFQGNDMGKARVFEAGGFGWIAFNTLLNKLFLQSWNSCSNQATYDLREVSKINDITAGHASLRHYMVTAGCTRDAAYFSVLSNDGPANSIYQEYYFEAHEAIAHTVKPTTDGGYLLVGELGYNVNAPVASRYDKDLLLIKLDAAGEMEWSKFHGDGEDEIGYDFVEKEEGNGYMVVGYTESRGTGGKDVYLLDVSADGNLINNFAYGAELDDIGKAIKQTQDGGYIIVGSSTRSGDNKQTYILKTNEEGKI